MVSRLTREDFEPTHEPLSLKDLIINEMASRTQTTKTGDYYPPFPAESMEALLKAVYRRIEEQTFAEYNSNQLWALRQYYLDHLLDKDAKPDEVTIDGVDNILKPIIDWQNDQQTFDPIRKYKEKLEADGKPEQSIQTLLDPVCQFVARKGKKTTYHIGEVREHMAYLRREGYVKKIKNRDGNTEWKRIPYKKSTLVNIYNCLNSFFTFLHEDNSDMFGNMRKLITPPKPPDPTEMDTPMLESDDIMTMIADTVIDMMPVDWIQRLCVATIYGTRASELEDFEVRINGEHPELSTIFIKTKKNGTRVEQPIPVEVQPIFAVPVQRMSKPRIRQIFWRMCEMSGIDLRDHANPDSSRRRCGFHSIRRNVVTGYYNQPDLKEMEIMVAMRWSTKGQRQLGQLPTYVKIPVSEMQRKVINRNPFIPMWKTVIPLLFDGHPVYKSCANHQNVTFIKGVRRPSGPVREESGESLMYINDMNLS
jgi:hypothetical protein